MTAARAARSRPPIALPLAFAVAAGAGLSLQALISGKLRVELRSAELAGATAVVVSWTGLMIIAVASGAVRRAWRAYPSGFRPPPWWILVSVNGALYVIVGAAAAAKIGVAVLTVALVCGQALGGLASDHAGLSTAGRRHVTRARAAGVVLAVVAVVIGAVDAPGHFEAGLLALAVLTGALLTVQQAALSHMTRLTGEPFVAAWVNTSVALVTIIVVVLVTSGGAIPDGASSPAIVHLLAPGLIGVAFLIMVAVVVRVLGLLRLTLAVVAGQAVGALGLDLIAPAPDRPVTAATVISVVLTFAAVAISSAGMPSRRDAAPIEP